MTFDPDAFASGIVGFMVLAVVVFVVWLILAGAYNMGYESARECLKYNISSMCKAQDLSVKKENR